MSQINMTLSEYPTRMIEMNSPCLFWKREPDDRLLLSLQARGQCVPVLVESDGRRVRLLAGQRRITALIRMGQPVIACHMQPMTPWERGLVFLGSNSGQPLDDAMMVRALRYFYKYEGDPDSIAPHLGLEPRSRQWQLLKQWMDLPPIWDDFLDQGHVPLVLVQILRHFQAESLCALELFFRDLSWSRNNAIHFVAWLWEVSRSRQIAPEVLLNKLRLEPILQQNLSPKDTMIRIVEAIRVARFPHLSALENGFRSKAAEVTAGMSWHLVQPDHFETGTVELLTRINSRADLKKRVHELETLASHPIWSDPAYLGWKE